MISLEQVNLLETKVVRAIEHVSRVDAENAALRQKETELRAKLDAYQKRVDELEVLVLRFKEDQSRIEDGILSALDRLNQFEEAVEKSLAEKTAEGKTSGNKGAVKSSPVKSPVKTETKENPAPEQTAGAKGAASAASAAEVKGPETKGTEAKGTASAMRSSHPEPSAEIKGAASAMRGSPQEPSAEAKGRGSPPDKPIPEKSAAAAVPVAAAVGAVKSEAPVTGTPAGPEASNQKPGKFPSGEMFFEIPEEDIDEDIVDPLAGEDGESSSSDGELDIF